MRNFGDKLRAEMKRKGISQQMLEDRTKRSKNTISKWCRSKDPPHGQVLHDFADALGVTAEFLLSDVEDQSREGLVFKAIEGLIPLISNRERLIVLRDTIDNQAGRLGAAGRMGK